MLQASTALHCDVNVACAARYMRVHTTYIRGVVGTLDGLVVDLWLALTQQHLQQALQCQCDAVQMYGRLDGLRGE